MLKKGWKKKKKTQQPAASVSVRCGVRCKQHGSVVQCEQRDQKLAQVPKNELKRMV